MAQCERMASMSYWRASARGSVRTTHTAAPGMSVRYEPLRIACRRSPMIPSQHAVRIAEAEEGQAGLAEDGDRRENRCIRDHRRHRIGQSAQTYNDSGEAFCAGGRCRSSSCRSKGSWPRPDDRFHALVRMGPAHLCSLRRTWLMVFASTRSSREYPTSPERSPTPLPRNRPRRPRPPAGRWTQD